MDSRIRPVHSSSLSRTRAPTRSIRMLFQFVTPGSANHEFVISDPIAALVKPRHDGFATVRLITHSALPICADESGPIPHRPALRTAPTAPFSPDLSEDSHFSPRCGHGGGSLSDPGLAHGEIIK